MSATAGKIVGKIGQASKAAGKAAESSGGPEKQGVLLKGAKKDPELYILLAIMSGAFGLVGLHFGRKPTSASSEQSTTMAAGTMPWQVDSSKGEGPDGHFKYQYHPGGDRSKAPKNAPSALHSVIVPNVNLPKSLHDKYNKWGKDGY